MNPALTNSSLVTVVAGIFIAVIVAVAFVIAFRAHTAELLEDLKVLRNIVNVNLEILTRELEELTAISLQSPESADVIAAKLLLSDARNVADATTGVETASKEDLGEFMTKVFAAMGKTTRARHLLRACRPSILE